MPVYMDKSIIENILSRWDYLLKKRENIEGVCYKDYLWKGNMKKVQRSKNE